MQESFINENIIRCSLQAVDAQEVINKLGSLLQDAGYVNEAYVETVQARELNFPTGIVLAGAAIAIPHASPQGNVDKDGIAVAKLANKVPFHSMEEPEEIVQADMAFMLAVKEPEQHLNVLNALFTAFQNNKIVESLLQAENPQVIYQILKENLSKN